MSNVFTKAKAYQRKHPRTSWQDAIQAVSRKGKKAPAKKKKASYRQTGGSNKRNDSMRKAKAPGKRKSASGNVYYERRKNRSDVPGRLLGTASMYDVRDRIEKMIAQTIRFQDEAKRNKDKRAIRVHRTALVSLKKQLREQNSLINKMLR